MKTKSRLLSGLLALIMVAGMFAAIPFTAYADDVSFTKVTSVDQITEDNIGACTRPEALNWIVENWDSIQYGPSGSACFAYWWGTSLCMCNVNNSMSQYEYPVLTNEHYDDITVTDLVNAFNEGKTVYLCTAAAPGPAPEEPASTFSFTKATSADQITEDNIDTCTDDEAKAWILENWDDVIGDGTKRVNFAYYNSDNGNLNAYRFDYFPSKDYFSNDPNSYLSQGVIILTLHNSFEVDGDTVYLCTAAAPASTVSFTKVTSADQITEDNIDTCTDDEAKAWLLANWDDVFDGTNTVDFVYYNSNNGNLNAWYLNFWSSKDDFSSITLREGILIDALQLWYGSGEDVYLCTSAAPEPASTVSFTKVTSADQITEDNIGTCTADEAKAWFLANWDAVHENDNSILLAFHTNSGNLKCVSVMPMFDAQMCSDLWDSWPQDSNTDDLQFDFTYMDSNVYLCTAAAPGPASTVSFTEVSSEDEITAGIIRTCTKEQVQAWILENWDDVVDENKCVDFAFYNSDNGELNALCLNLSHFGSKEDFSNNVNNYLQENLSISDLQLWYGFGDTVYLCGAAAPAPKEISVGYAQVGADYDPQFVGDTYASLWQVTVEPGDEAIESVGIKVTAKESGKAGTVTGEIPVASGPIVFGVVVNGRRADIDTITAIVNDEEVSPFTVEVD